MKYDKSLSIDRLIESRLQTIKNQATRLLNGLDLHKSNLDDKALLHDKLFSMECDLEHIEEIY